MAALPKTIGRSLTGALAGFLATVPMSIWMVVGHRALSWRSQEALPPAKITRQVLCSLDAHDDLSRDQEAAIVVVNHFAYGSAMGAVYAPLTRSKSASSAIMTGAAFGLAVWTGSYCGWLPAMGLYRPPSEDTAERTGLMVGAHLLWGGTLGLFVHWLSQPAERGSDGRDEHSHINTKEGRSHESAMLARQE